MYMYLLLYAHILYVSECQLIHYVEYQELLDDIMHIDSGTMYYVRMTTLGVCVCLAVCVGEGRGGGGEKGKIA